MPSLRTTGARGRLVRGEGERMIAAMAAPLVIRVPDPSLVVLVGAAGSGKSTFAARHFAPDEILSSDAFRGLVSGDASDQGATKPAFAALHRALAHRLAHARLTVVDATNVQEHARRGLLRRAAAAGVPAVAIVLDLPAHIVLARNAARDGSTSVPEAAVRRQLDDLARTVARETLEGWRGYASVRLLADPADVDRVVIVREVRRVGPAPPANAAEG